MNAKESPPPHILNTLATAKWATHQDGLSLGRVIDAFGGRAYGSLLFVTGLAALSPLGAIPGASILCASIVVLLALQMSLRPRAPWIPKLLRRVEVSGDRARSAIEWIEPYVARTAALTRPRFNLLLDGVATHVVTGALLLLAASMYPLAVVPLGVMPSAIGITAIGIGLVSRDGLFILVGIMSTAAVGALGIGVMIS